MTDEAESGALHKVYSATTAAELADAYAAWSPDYERETLGLGYCLPFVVTAWVARHIPKGNGPLLDAGCGTGLTGPYLKALGYEDLHGLDFSAEMLAVAEARGAYTKLTKASLDETLPWDDGRFAGFVSTGVFTEGHVPASALDELVRITRSGGHAVFTVRDTVLESGGFPDVFEWLEKADRWRRLEESPLFRAFAIAEPEVLVKAFAFKVL